MHSFIVTTHNNHYEIIKKCLDLIIENCIKDSIILLYVNETTDERVLNIKKEYIDTNLDDTFIIEEQDNDNNIINTINVVFKTFYIHDQLENNGLTGTWNNGINYILENYNDVKIITLLGHDTFLNSSIVHIFKKAEEAFDNNILEYYGPLYKNWKGKNDELWQDEYYYKNHKLKFLIGSLLCIPINSIKKNKLKNNEYFDNKYPFGYNDIDWYNRFIKIGGKPIIVENCIIEHKYNRSWISVDPRLKNKYIPYKNLNIIQIFNKYENDIKNIDFNWLNYIKANPNLQLKNEIEAIKHYMTIGKYTNRPLRISN